MPKESGACHASRAALLRWIFNTCGRNFVDLRLTLAIPLGLTVRMHAVRRQK